MKTETFTIKDAFAWDKSVLHMKLMKENNKSFVLGDVNLAAVMDTPYTSYYSDAVRKAMTRYIADKVCVLDRDIKVAMTVKTKNGLEPYYEVSLGRFVFDPTANMIDLQCEVVEPTVRKLAIIASREVSFADVESVSCYVEEVDSYK